MTGQRDFFISFTSADLDVATAIDEAVRGAGFTTWFHPRDKPAGAGIANWMETALEATQQMIAICSPDYFDQNSAYSIVERQSMFWENPKNDAPLLLLVKVRECKIPRLIAQNEYRSVVGMTGAEAGASVVEWLSGEQARQARLAAEEVGRSRRHPPHFNVPGSRNPHFTGREAEMERLHERIASSGPGAHAITAVRGMGGVGKTTLAREYALRHGTAAHFGGVWWIPAETETGILTALAALAGRIDISEKPDQAKTAREVCAWLGSRPDAAPWLVIFDNAPDAAAVKGWLPGGTARVLITSRYSAFGGIAEEMSLDVWDEDTTVRFLRERVGRGTEEEARALARGLGGLPLAAEQAAAFLRERSTVGYAEYGARLVQMLARKPATMTGDYPDSLYATFAAAIEAVADREEGEAALAILNICAFLAPEGVELKLFTQVGATMPEEMFPDPPRGALGDTLRCGDAVAALENFALVKTGEDVADQTLTMHRLLGEVVRDRLDAAEKRHWSGAAVRMVRAAMPYDSDEPQYWGVATRLTRHALALAPLDLGDGDEARALDSLLNQAAGYFVARGNRSEAIDLLIRSVAIKEASRLDKPLELAAILGNLAGRLAEEDDTRDEAARLYRRALDILERELGPDDPRLATTLSNFGGLYRRNKDFAEAVEYIARAAEIDRKANGETSAQYAIRLSNLGAAYCDWWQTVTDPAERTRLQGLEREAKEKSAAMTRAARGTRHPQVTAHENNLAVMYANDGDFSRAAAHMVRCVAIELSLDQKRHPDTQNEIEHLIAYWHQSGQSDKAERLLCGDGSDLLPIVEQIEEEHRQWVAEDPENRHFGPPSPVTKARE